MMLNITQLSFWERKEYFENIDFLVIGGGIVGCSTAFHLKQKYKNAKIVILEKGYLPCGASTKNAGFASFGGPFELYEDLTKHDAALVWDTVQARYEGLLKLRELLGDKAIDFQQNGGWDLVTENVSNDADKIRENLSSMNVEMQRITGCKEVFVEDATCPDRFGFNKVHSAFKIQLEGQVDTGKLMKAYHELVIQSGVVPIFGIDVQHIDQTSQCVVTNIGEIQASNVLVTVNGFAGQLLSDLDVAPARAQVVVTSPIKNLKVKGTFHYDYGYYFFRNFENRILLGGGRNLDFEGERTTEFGTTDLIQTSLKKMLDELILPSVDYQIEYSWSGIMGMGNAKNPIIKKVNDNLGVGVRLGGIGVALGTNVGRKLADLF